MTKGGLLVVCVLLGSCGGSAPAQPRAARPPPRVDAAEPPAPSPGARWTEGVPARDVVRAVVCDGFPPECVVDRLSSAGASDDGAALYVARVLPTGACRHPEVCTPLEPEPASVPEWDPAGGTYAFDAEVCGDDIDECGRMSFVLVAVRPTGATTRLLTEVAIWDHGAAGLGADAITIRPNRFSRSSYGGSNERFTNEMTIQLDPPRVLAIESEYVHAVFGGRSRVTWSVPGWSGFGVRDNDACGARPRPPRLVGIAIPWVELAGADAWRTAELGDCAASMRRHVEMPSVDAATGEIGPAPAPSPDAPRIYRTGDSLVLEVPQATPSVTVWIARFGDGSSEEGCVEVHARPVRVPVAGVPAETRDGLQIERVTASQRVRLRLTIENGEPMMAPAAVDVDGFRTVDYGRGRPLVEGPFTQPVRCEVRDGALHRAPTALPDPPEALVDQPH